MLEPERRWCERSAPNDLIAELEHDLGISALAARLLALRGVEDADQAQRFLRKHLQDLIPPEQMRDMAVAARRLAQAIDGRETIVVHGDYDVDGSTATALITLFCRACSHDAIGWIPDRRIDGYGLSEASLQAVREHQAALMITVDCGIADQGWAARIEAETGCQVIITDHHLPQDALPQCTAVCNPHHPDCTYPDKGLAGVGVAWKLCWATAKILSGGERVTDRLRSFLLDSLSLVAIGTVADCAPLDGENRILVHHGIAALGATTNHGLRALLSETRLAGEAIQADDLGWKIGPLLNASGRVSSAMANLHLLGAHDPTQAHTALESIVTDNTERRRLTQNLVAEITAEIEGHPAHLQRQTLVFAGDGWHPGVVGIVAGRLAERYQKPTAIIGIADGIGKGSLRTIPGIALGPAIDACRPLLLAGGGHAMAAGITIASEQVPAFIDAFESFVANAVPGGLPLPGTIYDSCVTIAEIGNGFFDEYAALAPFGTNNPPPVLLLRGVRFAGRPTIFGRNGGHLRGALTDHSGGLQQLIAWNVKPRIAALCQPGLHFDLLLRPELNCWKGRVQPRLQFVDGTTC